VVNKADLPGTDNAVAALTAMLDLNQAHTEWHHGQMQRSRASRGSGAGLATAVLKTCALRGEALTSCWPPRMPTGNSSATAGSMCAASASGSAMGCDAFCGPPCWSGFWSRFRTRM